MTVIPINSNDPDQPEQQLLTIAQVARRLDVEVRHVRRLVFERRIPFIRWGHLLGFDRTGLPRVRLTSRTPGGAGREGCPDAQAVPAGVRA